MTAVGESIIFVIVMNLSFFQISLSKKRAIGNIPIPTIQINVAVHKNRPIKLYEFGHLNQRLCSPIMNARLIKNSVLRTFARDVEIKCEPHLFVPSVG